MHIVTTNLLQIPGFQIPICRLHSSWDVGGQEGKNDILNKTPSSSPSQLSVLEIVVLQSSDCVIAVSDNVQGQVWLERRRWDGYSILFTGPSLESFFSFSLS